MGVLDRWDRRNQETVEFHNDLVDVDEEVSGWQYLGICAAIGIVPVLTGVVLRAAGLTTDTAATVRIALLLAVSLILGVIGVKQRRRRREQWRRDRRSEATDR